MSRGKWLALLCLVPFAVFFIVFQIAPLVWVLIHSVQSEDSGWGLANFSKIFSFTFKIRGHLSADVFNRRIDVPFHLLVNKIVIAIILKFLKC